jgi:hypothetical protein
MKKNFSFAQVKKNEALPGWESDDFGFGSQFYPEKKKKENKKIKKLDIKICSIKGVIF